jgi:hypothetical protein
VIVNKCSFKPDATCEVIKARRRNRVAIRGAIVRVMHHSQGKALAVYTEQSTHFLVDTSHTSPGGSVSSFSNATSSRGYCRSLQFTTMYVYKYIKLQESIFPREEI